MTAPAVEAVGLSKRYYLGEDTSRRRLTHALVPWFNRTVPEEFWAIRNLTFAIQEGEAVGILGQNGAGKSTLLKVLSRITAPTEGRVRISGRVGTLLEIGTGFHMELSGRENIFLSGTILGLSQREIAAKFDEIVAFSEIEKFIDTPVKRYSSGMFVRLAFAVAVHLDPEILIVDEVLAVGDLGFQRKSLKRLDEATIKGGRTILFVSHSLASVRQFCRRVIVLQNGRLTFDGPADDGVDYYMSTMIDDRAIKNTNLKDRLQRTNGAVRITRVSVLGADGQRKWSFSPGETARYVVEYEVLQPVPDMLLLLRLYSHLEAIKEAAGTIVSEIREVVTYQKLQIGQSGTVEITLPNLKLTRNEFAPYICLGPTDGSGWYDVVDADNVALPPLVIKGDRQSTREGYFSLDYDFKVTHRNRETQALLLDG
jgi:lipopolysaccharide transport system ATP-binding protein